MKKFLTGLAIGLALLATPVGAVTIFNGQQGGTGIGTAGGGDVGKVLTVSSVSPLVWTLSSVGAGSQTPWTQNINGATYSLSGVGSLDATSSVITQATSTNFYTANLVVGALNGVLQATNGSVTGGATTSNVPEGSNLYYTLLRWASAMAGTTTDALTEGSNNLYFTNARAQSALTGYFATTTASNTWGGTQSFTNTANFNGITNNGDATTTHLSITGLSVGDLALSSSGRVYSHASTTFSGGLLWSAGNVTNTLTAGDGLTRTVDDFDCDTANASTFGCLPSADFTSFNAKISSSSLSATYPLAYNSATGAFTYNGLGTTTAWTAGQLAYVVNGNTVTSVATGTLSGTNGVTVTSNRYVVGGSATVDCTAGSASSVGCIQTGDWSTFNNKISSTSLSGASVISYTSGTGVITTTGGTFGAGNYTFPSGVSWQSGTGTSVYASGSSTLAWLNSASSSITLLALPAVTSAITLTNGNGNVSAYAGTSCTNQFVRSLSALGVATCATVQTTDVASGIALDSELPVGANPTASIGLSANNGVATTFMRSDATPALSQSITPTWSALHIFDAGLIATASSTIKFLTADKATTTSATTTNFAITGQLSFNSVNGSTWASFCTAITGGAGLCDGSDDGGGGGSAGNFSTTSDTFSIFNNWSHSVGFGTSTPSSKFGLINLATTSPKHIFMRNGEYKWYFGTTENGNMVAGTSSASGATSTTEFVFRSNGGLVIPGNGTSTMVNGLNLENGCLAYSNNCLGVMALTGTVGQVNYFSAVNTVVGTSSLFIATNQNIGIGTTSPWARLSVEGTSTLGNLAVAGYFQATSTATSTFGGAIRATCFTTNGIDCLSGGAGGSSSGVSGSVQFSAGGGTFSGDATNFFWDDTNKRLGIGSSTPMSALSVMRDTTNLVTIATSTAWNTTALHIQQMPSKFAFLNPRNWFTTFLGRATTSERFDQSHFTTFGQTNSDTLIARCDPVTAGLHTILSADATAAAGSGAVCGEGSTFDELTDADFGIIGAGLASTTDGVGVGGTNGCNDGGAWMAIIPLNVSNTQTAGIGGVLRGGTAGNGAVANTVAQTARGGVLTASGTPVMEITVCTPQASASSTFAFGFGFTDVALNTMPFNVGATTQDGSYFMASSTDTWRLVSHNGGSASANTDIKETTLSTTTTKSAPQTFRLARTATATYVYMLNYSQTPPTWTMVTSSASQQTLRPFSWFVGAVQTVVNNRRKAFYFRNLKVWYSPTYRF